MTTNNPKEIIMNDLESFLRSQESWSKIIEQYGPEVIHCALMDTLFNMISQSVDNNYKELYRVVLISLVTFEKDNNRILN